MVNVNRTITVPLLRFDEINVFLFHFFIFSLSVPHSPNKGEGKSYVTALDSLAVNVH
jgi:hypothetical protein